MRLRKALLTGFLAVSSFATVASVAEARPTIKNPNDHPDYRAELEPHANFILWHGRYGRTKDYRYNGFGDPEIGGGFRASIELGDPAFIPKINNTVDITFGIDLTNCRYCYRNYRYAVYNPVGVQWNFFLTDKWSVFAEGGLLLSSAGFYAQVYPDFFAAVGGRFHFTDKVALTMRLGQPFVSVGVSFFVGS